MSQLTTANGAEDMLDYQAAALLSQVSQLLRLLGPG